MSLSQMALIMFLHLCLNLVFGLHRETTALRAYSVIDEMLIVNQFA